MTTGEINALCRELFFFSAADTCMFIPFGRFTAWGCVQTQINYTTAFLMCLTVVFYVFIAAPWLKGNTTHIRFWLSRVPEGWFYCWIWCFYDTSVQNKSWVKYNNKKTKGERRRVESQLNLRFYCFLHPPFQTDQGRPAQLLKSHSEREREKKKSILVSFLLFSPTRPGVSNSARQRVQSRLWDDIAKCKHHREKRLQYKRVWFGV